MSSSQRDLDPKLNLIPEEEFAKDAEGGGTVKKPSLADPVEVQGYNLRRLEYESRKRTALAASKEELAAKKAKLSTQKRGTSRNLALIFKSFSDDFPAGSNVHDVLNPFLEPCLDCLKNHLQAYAKTFGGFDITVRATPKTALFSRGSVVLTLNAATTAAAATAAVAVAVANPFFVAEFRYSTEARKVVLFEGKDAKVSLKEYCLAGVGLGDAADPAVTMPTDEGLCVALRWVDDVFAADPGFSEAKVRTLDALKEKWAAFYELKKQVDVLSKLKLPPELKRHTVLLSSWRTVTLSLDEPAAYKTHFKKGHFNVEATVQIGRGFPEVPPQWEFADSQSLKKAGVSLAGLQSEVNTRFFGKAKEGVLLKQVALISEALSSVYDGVYNEQESVVGRDRRPGPVIKGAE